MFNSYSLLNLILRFFREGRRRIRISRLWSIYILLRVSEQKKNWRDQTEFTLGDKFKFENKFKIRWWWWTKLCRVKKVACQFHIYWKYISVWVDPRQFLRLFLSRRLKTKVTLLSKFEHFWQKLPIHDFVTFNYFR